MDAYLTPAEIAALDEGPIALALGLSPIPLPPVTIPTEVLTAVVAVAVALHGTDTLTVYARHAEQLRAQGDHDAAVSLYGSPADAARVEHAHALARVLLLALEG